MQEQNMEKMYILCGLSNEASDEIRTALTDAAKQKGYEAICVSRYRKEGIRQYIAEHKEFRILVLQEAMQTNYPYTAEELAELADDYHLNIVISIKKTHRANQYMKILYTAGILNALYEEDATAENIMKRILYPRTRRECREYYQITTAADAMRSLDIVDEERINQYTSYLEESFDNSEIRNKYKYIAQTLKPVENIYLAKRLSDPLRKALESDPLYQEVLSFQDKRKRWTFGRKTALKKQKKEEKLEAISFPGQIPPGGVIEEPEYQGRKEHSIEDMLDEDISDLLGFGNEVKLSKQQAKEMFSVATDDSNENGSFGKTQSKQEKTNEKHIRKEQSNLVRQGIIFAGMLLFLALVILFGFFLYSEYQKEETSEPAVYEQRTGSDANSDTNKGWEMQPEKKDISKQEKKQKGTEDNAGKNEESKEEKITASKEPATPEEPITVKKAVSSTVQPNENTRPSQYPQETPTKTEPSGQVIVETQQPPADLQEQEPEISYDGYIATGAEVISIAKKEEAKGIRLYLKTRDRGEGFFSAAEIAQLADGTCSYLVQNATTGQLSFIQQ